MYQVVGVINNVPVDPVGYTTHNNVVDVSVMLWVVATISLTLWFGLVATVHWICLC